MSYFSLFISYMYGCTSEHIELMVIYPHLCEEQLSGGIFFIEII